MFAKLSGTTPVQPHDGNGLNVIHRATLAVAVCGAMVLGSLGLTGNAEARMGEGDRMTETAQRCGKAQDWYDFWLIRYERAKTDEEAAEAKREMNYALDQWHSNDCFEHYGFIAFRTFVPSTQTSVELNDVAGNEQGPKTRKAKVGSTGNAGLEGAGQASFNLKGSASVQTAGIAP